MRWYEKHLYQTEMDARKSGWEQSFDQYPRYSLSTREDLYLLHSSIWLKEN